MGVWRAPFTAQYQRSHIKGPEAFVRGEPLLGASTPGEVWLPRAWTGKEELGHLWAPQVLGLLSVPLRSSASLLNWALHARHHPQ